MREMRWRSPPVFRVPDFGFRIPGSGFRIPGFRFRVSGSRGVQTGSWVLGSGIRDPGSGSQVSISRSRVSDSGFRILGFGVPRASGEFWIPNFGLRRGVRGVTALPSISTPLVPDSGFGDGVGDGVVSIPPSSRFRVSGFGSKAWCVES